MCIRDRGYTMQVDEGNHYLMSKEEMENKIATCTGGRAAEEVVFGSITTGASNDIEQATRLARAMITQYGMSEDFDMVALETVTNQYLGGDASLACSAEKMCIRDRFGTVGLSTGITPGLSVAGKVVIILVMYTGRIGAFTLLSMWIEHPEPNAR